ncbi:MAG TPA: TolC family protein [Opitutaceae bacterium]|nr:TolC family protein [Opitutaceae bacterium]
MSGETANLALSSSQHMSPRTPLARLVLAALLTASCATVASAQSPTAEVAAPAAAPLTLADCVQRALTRNFDAEIGRFDTANAAATVDIARASFDPVLRASSTRSGYRTEGATRATSGWNNRLGASQHLATGTDVTVSTGLNRTKNRLSNPYNPAYDSDVALTITQPLLKGFGTAANRAALEQARLGVDRAGYFYRGTMMDIVRDTEIAYYELHFTRRQLAVRRVSLEAAQRLLDENRVKRDKGVLTDLEVLTADVGVATQQRNVLLAEQQLHNAEDALRALIGQFELDAPLGETAFTGAVDAAPTVDDTFGRAKAAQPEILALQANIEQLRIELAKVHRNRLPQLDLTSTLGYDAQRRTASDALDDLPGSDGYNWQVGLEIVYPLGSRGERARLIQATNDLSRARLQLRQLEQDVLVRARSSVRAVDTNREAVRVATLASELSERQYELEKERFDVGMSTARRVLDAQADLDDARVALVSSQVDLLTAFANLRRLEGRSLEIYPGAEQITQAGK